MLKTLFATASLSVLLCCASADSLRSQLFQANTSIHGFMVNKDAAGFKNYMKGFVTKDFKYMEEGRVETFDQMCAGMAMGLAQMKKISKAQSRIVELKEEGNTAVATTQHEMEGTSMGPDHKMHVMTFKGTSSDSYVKVGGKWKMSKMEWGKQTMLVDGKPMKE